MSSDPIRSTEQGQRYCAAPMWEPCAYDDGPCLRHGHGYAELIHSRTPVGQFEDGLDYFKDDRLCSAADEALCTLEEMGAEVVVTQIITRTHGPEVSS